MSMSTQPGGGGGSVNEAEVNKFNGVEWWDGQSGPMKPLLSMNKLRVASVRDGILKGSELEGSDTLNGFRILDVGCGGGILSEGLGQLGATVVGMKNVTISRNHLSSGLASNVLYECTTIETYALQHPDATFDAVVMSEVIEHVENPKEFISTALKLLKVNGSLFITTPNENSFILARRDPDRSTF